MKTVFDIIANSEVVTANHLYVYNNDTRNSTYVELCNQDKNAIITLELVFNQSEFVNGKHVVGIEWIDRNFHANDDLFFEFDEKSRDNLCHFMFRVFESLVKEMSGEESMLFERNMLMLDY